MKTTTFLCALVIGCAAVPARAATLRMNFVGGGAGNVATLAPTDTVDVEIWMDLGANDSLTGFEFSFENTPTNIGELSMVGHVDGPVPAANGWTYNTLPGNLSNPIPLIPEVAMYNSTPLLGPLTVLLTTVEIQHTGSMTSGSTELVFFHDLVTILEPTGGLFTYWPTFANLPGFWEYGSYGSAGVNFLRSGGSQPRDPLTVNFVPEPASIVLLALGGLALLRRRR